MSKFEQRIVAMEAAVSAKARSLETMDIIRVIIAPDRSIVGAMRRAENGSFVSVSENELANMQRGGNGSNQFGNSANLQISEVSQTEAALGH